jgi:transposase
MLPADLPIWVAIGTVDFHWSFDRLVGVVRNQLQKEPTAGLFVFVNRNAKKAKVLFYDGSGWCILYKRLDQGIFPRPETFEGHGVSVQVSIRELQLMLVGRNLPTRRQSEKKSRPTIH